MEVANAQMNLSGSRLPNVETSRQRLNQAMSQLEVFLSSSPQHQGNWLAFLNWNELQNQLNKAKPDQEKLLQIEKAFRQNYLGLEMSQFTNVRDALKQHLVALRFSSDPAKTIEVLGLRLNKLSEQLQMPSFQQDFGSTREVSQTVSFLSQADQASDLVRQVRANYSRANVRVLVSDSFVRSKFSRPVSESNPVNENILGTQLYGQSVLQGFVTPQLLESSTNAALRLNLNGNFSSQNIGYNRSIKLHTQGYGNLAASETIALTDNGLVALNDTSVDANLSSQIDDIEARLRIVRRIAAKQAEGRLENRVKSQFHDQLATQVSQANAKIKTPELPILKRFGIDKPNRTTWSSSQYVALLWKVQQATQFAAPTSCPLVVDPSGITVQLHESVVTNITDPILAGRILRSTELPALAAQFEGLLGKSLVADDKEKWAVTLDGYHPIEVQLDNSLITFRIRTLKLDRGDQELDQPASIEASYLLSLVDGAIQLTRQGDVKIDFSGKQQRGVRAVTLRSFLKKKFEEVFKQTLLDKPLRVTDKLPSDLQGLQLVSIQVDDGWIQAHLR
jgi:hypothetical protein